MENVTEQQKITAKHITVIGISFLAALLVTVAAYYLRTLLYSESDKLVYFGAYAVSWHTYTKGMLACVMLILGVCVLFLPRRFKYLYLGLIIGYILFVPNTGVFWDYSLYDILYGVGIF